MNHLIKPLIFKFTNRRNCVTVAEQSKILNRIKKVSEIYVGGAIISVYEFLGLDMYNHHIKKSQYINQLIEIYNTNKNKHIETNNGIIQNKNIITVIKCG